MVPTRRRQVAQQLR